MIGSFDGFQLEVAISTPLAVVPIVVNAGAALLPAFLAGTVSFVAILFKPKEMLRICKAKPWIPITVLIERISNSQFQRKPYSSAIERAG